MLSNFSRMPSISLTRSKFIRKSQHKTSIKLGELTPIYLDEVLPGDTRSIDLGSLIRMSTPVTPVMDNIYADVYAFFVPNRLAWIHWKEFMGENNSSAGIYSGSAYTIPKTNVFGFGITTGSVGDHMGLPILSPDLSKTLNVSALPIRGYRLIYNRFFRDQNVIAPVTVNTSDSGNSNDSYNLSLFKVAKVSDYFTRSLPYAQKGSPVSIPLATTAPVNVIDELHHMGGPLQLAPGSGSPTVGSALVFAADGVVSDTNSSTGTASGQMVKSNLVVDLSTATAATINQLRFAFQYQKLLEKDALYGTRLTAR